MNFYNLASDESSQCFIINFKNTNILVDCSLNVNSLLSQTNSKNEIKTNKKRKIDQLQETEEKKISIITKSEKEYLNVQQIKLDIPSIVSFDMSSVDLILISNFKNILCLPFITEKTKFKGKILSTEPTIKIGEKLMTEISTELKLNEESAQHYETKNLEPLKLDYLLKWKNVFSLEEIHSCIEKIQTISFEEYIDIYGQFKVSAVSSGFSIGSANWCLESEFEKIVVLSSSSSSTSRHPQEFQIEPLKNANVAIFSDISDSNENSTPDTMLTELCKNIGNTISNGGDVLIPCHSSGIIYDLIDYLRKYLNSLNLHSTNMYFVSPTSEFSLAYSNISSEWLCETKQVKSYEANDPFDHGSMLKSGDLKIFTGLDTKFANVFHQNRANPCIIFAGDPSLRFGEVIHLMKLFNKNPKNSMILIEPEYNFEKTIGIYKENLVMQVVSCPIDLRMNQYELVQLINQITPENIILPNFLIKNEEISNNKKVIFSKYLDSFQIDLQNKFEKAKIDVKLAKQIHPIFLNELNVSMIHATLESKDGNHTLSSIDDSKAHSLFGDLKIQEIFKSLEKHGCKDYKVEKIGYGEFKICISDGNYLTISNEKTKIETNSSQKRKLLKTVIIENFYVL
eukprot:gene1710-479_t